jgi:hypothetical protein
MTRFGSKGKGIRPDFPALALLPAFQIKGKFALISLFVEIDLNLGAAVWYQW